MGKNLDDIVITNALRTPIGRYKGKLSLYQAHDLGCEVIKNLLEQSKLSSEDVDEVVMGQVLTGKYRSKSCKTSIFKCRYSKFKNSLPS